jgi:hypothetical protein
MTVSFSGDSGWNGMHISYSIEMRKEVKIGAANVVKARQLRRNWRSAALRLFVSSEFVRGVNSCSLLVTGDHGNYSIMIPRICQ